MLSAGPILATLGISLTAWDLLTPARFVGLDNSHAPLDDRFWTALRNTAYYTLVSVPLGMALALAIALASTKVRGIACIRTMYFLPLVTSSVAVGLVWLWIYSPQAGLLNEVLWWFRIPPQRWVCDPSRDAGHHRDERLAGPGHQRHRVPGGAPVHPAGLLDAASVDGAGRWARFRSITLPLLTPSIFFTGILSLIGAIQVFDQVYVLSRPRATEANITLVYFIYEEGFRNFRMGSASAAAWILFVIAAGLTIVYFWSQRRWVHYQ